jgi:hypothetical protein
VAGELMITTHVRSDGALNRVSNRCAGMQSTADYNNSYSTVAFPVLHEGNLKGSLLILLVFTKILVSWRSQVFITIMQFGGNFVFVVKFGVCF